MLVKVCGLTRKEDVEYCIKSGVNILGFILADSPRRASLEEVKKISSIFSFNNNIKRAAVVVNPEPEELKEIIDSRLFNIIQFHGSESPELIKKVKLKTFKVFSITDESDLEKINDYQESADFYLFDTKTKRKKGGTGKTFDWSLLDRTNINKPYFLAGGLGPENLEEVLRQRPDLSGVDLNSRVEDSPGCKNHKLIARSLKIIKAYI